MERTNCYWALFNLTRKGAALISLAGWKDLVLSGVTKILDFGVHSTRSTSTSKAELSGLSVKEVLDWGSWSNESIWQNFYHKENIKVGQDYQKKNFKR